jgi:predicted phage terminase large subunit-like protein
MTRRYTDEQLQEIVRQRGDQLQTVARARVNKYIPHVPWPKQEAFLILPVREAFYGGAAGGGKGSNICSNIITPFGLRPLGSVKVGTQVCNPDGTVARVIKTWPLGIQRLYRVHFSDGSITDCTADHLWFTWEAGKRYKAQRTDINGERLHRGRIYLTSQIQREIDQKGYAFCIPLTAPVPFTVSHKYDMRVVDPYTLGVLLGDGSLHNTVSFSGVDPDIALRVEGTLSVPLGRVYSERNECCSYNVPVRTGLREQLERLGLMGKYAWEKFIPKAYLYASIESREALLQGLMDTDGTVDSRGHLSFCTTSKQLGEDVKFLVQSLGGTATITTKNPTYTYKGEKLNGRLAYVLYIKLPQPERAFYLPRKRAMTQPQQNYLRRIVGIEEIHSAEAMCITVDHPNGLYLTDDFVVTHNSDALMMAALQYVDMPGYAALLLRKTYADLSKPGALLTRSKEWLMNTDAKWHEVDKTWTFPSGAKLTFGYLEHEADKYKYQSAEFQYIGFDELTHFSESQYRFLFSRLRRLQGSPIPLRMRSASNPGGPGHEWVKQRFIVEGPQFGRIYIPAKLPDNPSLDQEDYVKSLAELDPVTREQMLNGDWSIRPPGGKFKHEWFEMLDPEDLPRGMKYVRYWDLAASDPLKTKRGDADWTVGAKVGEKDGIYYIVDIKRVQRTPMEVEELIKRTAHEDGPTVDIWMEQEPGSSGVNTIDHYRRIVLKGYTFRGNKTTGTKEARANPVSAAAEAGNVKILRATWVNTLLDEMDAFPEGVHDDQVDAISGAVEKLAAVPGTVRLMGIVRRNIPGVKLVFGDKFVDPRYR